jgi:hypothetical protein
MVMVHGVLLALTKRNRAIGNTVLWMDRGRDIELGSESRRFESTWNTQFLTKRF